MEKWLMDNALEVALLVFGGVFGYIKLGNYVTKVGDQMKKIGGDLETHYRDPNPHRACAVEQERYSNICGQLSEIKGKLDILDGRTIAILQNGHGKEDHGRKA